MQVLPIERRGEDRLINVNSHPVTSGFRKTRFFYLKKPSRVGFWGFIGFLDTQSQQRLSNKHGKGK